MIVEKELLRLFQELQGNETAKITVFGIEITLKIVEKTSKLSLSASVYSGENYIPPSVREGLAQRPSFDRGFIQTFLNIDEENYEISLHYHGHPHCFTSRSFSDLLEHFGDLADHWRQFLDERDRNDLIHVRHK